MNAHVDVPTISQIVTTTDPRVITRAFVSRAGLVWWLQGAEDGHEKAIANMIRTREWSSDDAFWRKAAHQKLRRARRSLRRARAELAAYEARRAAK